MKINANEHFLELSSENAFDVMALKHWYKKELMLTYLQIDDREENPKAVLHMNFIAKPKRNPPEDETH